MLAHNSSHIGRVTASNGVLRQRNTVIEIGVMTASDVELRPANQQITTSHDNFENTIYEVYRSTIKTFVSYTDTKYTVNWCKQHDAYVTAHLLNKTYCYKLGYVTITVGSYIVDFTYSVLSCHIPGKTENKVKLGSCFSYDKCY